ncbi:MAG TPA: alkaline phosphatase D family protein [Thermoguttaceae bacterium]|nr:alkaline phosphatase D family protein [Thermoguttaceae bacterium]
MQRYPLRSLLPALCAGAALFFSLVFTLDPALGAQPRNNKQPRAAKEKPEKKPTLSGQTKRIGQEQILAVIDGDPELAVERCLGILEIEPNHLESLYNLTIALAHLGRQEEAVATMQRALAAGLPPGRFVAGPRGLLEPLAEHPEFQKLLAAHAEKLIHGPMLGCVTDRSAKFWVRTAEEVSVQVLLRHPGDLSDPIKSATVFTEAERDFTAVAEVERLQPDTVYYYDVLLKGKSQLGSQFPSFRTFPPQGEPARFQVGFGGGAGYTPKHEGMWNTVASHDLTAFLLLGDNVYIDNPTRPDVQHYTYYRRQSRPEYRRFVASTPVFAIWDDHDFGVNDCVYGSKIDEPAWKPEVWRVFRDNWNNPAYGGGERQPGCWFRFSIGQVDFFMLDCRFYRDSPNLENPSMLGRAQKAWLFKELERSEATFKVLASSVPWVLEAKGDSLDTWRGFQAERQEIFSFLAKEKIDGVILLSADRHRSDLWRIEREGAYPLYEFESSRLTNVHTHGVMPGSLFGYNEKCSFGQLTFDTLKPDPEVTYRIYSIDDELIHTQVVRKSEISGP